MTSETAPETAPVATRKTRKARLTMSKASALETRVVAYQKRGVVLVNELADLVDHFDGSESAIANELRAAHGEATASLDAANRAAVSVGDIVAAFDDLFE